MAPAGVEGTDAALEKVDGTDCCGWGCGDDEPAQAASASAMIAIGHERALDIAQS